MPDLVSCSYRTVLRELKVLEQMSFIEFVRVRPVGLRGRPRNVWKATLAGLFFFFYMYFESNEDIPKVIINNYKDNLVLFQEWEYIEKNRRVYNQFKSNFILSILKRRRNIKDFNETLTIAKKYHNDYDTRSIYKDAHYVGMYWDLEDLIEDCLGIDTFLGLDTESEYHTFMIDEYIPYLFKNKNLRNEYMEIMEGYDKRFQNYEKLKQTLEHAPA